VCFYRFIEHVRKIVGWETRKNAKANGGRNPVSRREKTMNNRLSRGFVSRLPLSVPRFSLCFYLLVPRDRHGRVRARDKKNECDRAPRGKWESRRIRENERCGRQSREHGGEKRNIVPGMSSRKQIEWTLKTGSTKLANRLPKMESLPVCNFDCWTARAAVCASLRAFRREQGPGFYSYQL